MDERKLSLHSRSCDNTMSKLMRRVQWEWNYEFYSGMLWPRHGVVLISCPFYILSLLQ